MGGGLDRTLQASPRLVIVNGHWGQNLPQNRPCDGLHLAKPQDDTTRLTDKYQLL